MPQASGYLIYDRCFRIIISSGHYSGFTCTYLIKVASTEESACAKQSYENISKAHGVNIKYYYALKLIFNGKVFTDDYRITRMG